MIHRLLTANCEEIAVRIIHTCKEMNIETVAVYPTVGKETLHVQLAGYAVCVGGPRANDNYLNMKNILSAACMTACDTIHPGFDFLSESAKFVRLMLQCDLIFVGLGPDVIEQMGDKNNARHYMMEAGVPVIPGNKDLLETIQDVATITGKIGYPMLIEASSGGNRRGIRRTDYAEELANASDAAKAEAHADPRDDAIHTEKLIVEPRHVEVRLMVNKHGNVMHLYERDYSCRRRNQELLEEMPCHVLEEDVRERLFRDAVRAVEGVGYNSMEVVEFLLNIHGEYYFMEMNTRIQVEHTISEEMCGIDLVKQQICTTDGHKLTCRQEDIVCHGHATECRINAENIKYSFALSPGRVSFTNFPPECRIRIEDAVHNDYNISLCYDSMIAKITICMDTRLKCVKRIRSALEELLIGGVETNIEFQCLLPHYPTFIDDHYDTGFMKSSIKEPKEDRTVI